MNIFQLYWGKDKLKLSNYKSKFRFDDLHGITYIWLVNNHVKIDYFGIFAIWLIDKNKLLFYHIY